MCIYIYIYREREREREGKGCKFDEFYLEDASVGDRILLAKMRI